MINKSILVGRLTSDPAIRKTQSGISVASFVVAVDRRFKNDRGEYESDFIKCTAWRQTADFVGRYFFKGSKIGLVGSIQTGSYEKDGQTHYTTEVVVDEAYFVESKKGGDSQERVEQKTNETKRSYAVDDSDLPFSVFD